MSRTENTGGGASFEELYKKTFGTDIRAAEGAEAADEAVLALTEAAEEAAGAGVPAAGRRISFEEALRTADLAVSGAEIAEPEALPEGEGEEETGQTREDARPTRKKKKRRKKHYLLRLILLILIIAGIIYFLRSDFFLIEFIRVENNSYYTAEQVTDLAGAERGVNLFSAKTGAMKSALLADPYIYSASVDRKLPDTLVISVSERKEAAAVLDAGSYIIVDASGMVLRRTESEPALPLLEGLTTIAAEPGKALQVEQNSLLKGSLELIAAVENSDLFFKRVLLSGISARAYLYDSLYCEGDPSVILENLEGLKNVLYDLYSKEIRHGVVYVGKDGYFSYSPEVK